MTITFGIAASLQGRYALFGRQVLAGLQCYVDDANRAGGIDIGGTRRTVALIVEDDESSPATLRDRLNKLIEHDHVDILLGPYGSGLTDVAVNVARAHEMVLWNHSGSADLIFAHDPPWQVALISPASTYLRGVLQCLHDVDRSARRVALFSADTGFSGDVAAGVTDWLGRHAIDLIMHELYPSGAHDMDRRLTRIAADPPDWVLGVGRIEDDLALARALCTVRPAIKAAGLVVAGVEQLYDEIGAAAEGFIGPGQWEAAIEYAVDLGPSSREFASRYQARAGTPPDYPAAQGYAAGLIAQASIEAAGSLAQADLRAAAGELDCTTFYGPFAIDKKNGRQIAHEVVVTQWQNGERRVVGPPAVAEAELQYPFS